MTSAISFTVHHTSGQARAATLTTTHGDVPTPAFMPVATQGSVKGVTPDEVRALGSHIILANAYHLYLRPGADTIERLGGLHKFMGWDGPILTDSGGFQVFSLGGLRKVSDTGVEFTSHIDGSRHVVSPEDAMHYQEALGVDIAMALDQCPAFGDNDDNVRLAMERTHRWAERCRIAHTRPDQALFGIVQGGHDLEQRAASAATLGDIGFDGYAVGGLSVGEPRDTMHQVGSFTAPLLPEDKPRYLMGVGSPLDLVEAVGWGIDMFDCALPTRVARHGGIYRATGRVAITTARFTEDMGPLEYGCDCYACTRFSVAYVHHLFRAKELLAGRLATIHNLRFYQRLMAQLREAIAADTLADFQDEFRSRFTPSDDTARLAQLGKWSASRNGS
jgi:queuine tRNA-ribosyltransferase